MVLQGHTKDVLVLNYPIQSIVHRTSTSEVKGLLHAVMYSNEVATNINVLEVDQQALVATVDAVPCCCVSALTSGNPITWLATMYDGVGHNCFPIIKAFNFGIIGAHVLTTLHTDFDHTLWLQSLSTSKSRKNACVQMLWDEADTWEDSLRSLPYLKQFRFRSWKSLRETKGMEDMRVQQWLIFVPPSLCEVRVMTGARQDQCRLIYWKVDNQRGSWWNAFEQMVSRKDINGIVL
ncbi:hypothetical protein EDB92DRAFT_1820460 [Lactarius akahatsu]|uniref:Uncharacterized protein n=1 Tax=Lactarius akahatsu TaxID=416441 RepID=A0AAD4Q3E4_9AGAM|nr:hypothetical protein EDB92DRAFT_1820460 [Lactarius akahatsu]